MANFRSRPRYVLSIDDDPAIRFLVKSALSRLDNLAFTEAIDGLDGLEKLENSHPDLIILDVVMPRMDGIQFFKIIRTDERFKHLPVILLTGCKDSDKINEVLELGNVKFLSKPFFIDELIKTAAEFLNAPSKVAIK